MYSKHINAAIVIDRFGKQVPVFEKIEAVKKLFPDEKCNTIFEKNEAVENRSDAQVSTPRKVWHQNNVKENLNGRKKLFNFSSRC